MKPRDDAPLSPRTRVAKEFPGFFNRPNNEHTIDSIKQLAGGETNETWLPRTVSNKQFVVRLPGKGSQTFVNREHEAFNTQVAAEAGVTPAVFYDERNGKKITQYLVKPTPMSKQLLKDLNNLQACAAILKKLHQIETPFAETINVFERNRKMMALLSNVPEIYQSIRKHIDKIEGTLASYKIPVTRCHNDTTASNFILSQGQWFLIDLEYSNDNDPAWDLACFFIEAELDEEQEKALLKAYASDDKTFIERYNLYKPVVEYWTGLWYLVQIQNGNGDVSGYFSGSILAGNFS